MTKAVSEPLPPGSTIGILGGGQLGRMLAIAAADLGFRCHIFCPDPASPAFDVAADHLIADYDDTGALETFAAACDVITYEFENVPAETAARLAEACPVRPSIAALDAAQDRLAEKRFIEGLDIDVAPFRQIDQVDDIVSALDDLGRPAILKTRRLGYDGKGQARLDDGSDPVAAFRAIGGAPAVLEALVPFTMEISIIAARDVAGNVIAFDPAENRHEDGILRESRVAARVGAETVTEAKAIARTLLDALDYVGVIGVELFVVRENSTERLLVNEFAPRVHNSGHWTMDVCVTDQFAQHIRAIAGWPLGDATRMADAVMTNLIGDDIHVWRSLGERADHKLHIYGKHETRAGRKMGHVTRVIGDSAGKTSLS